MGQSQPGPTGPQGPQGIQGAQGPKGDSIADISVQNGIFKVKTSSGTVFEAPAGGPPGPQGTGIKSISLDDIGGTLSFNLTDGTSNKVSSQFTSKMIQDNSLWCSGTHCRIPLTKKGIDWGYGGSRITDEGELTIHTDNNLYAKVGGNDTVKVTKDALFVQNRNILEELDTLKAKTSKFNTSGDVAADRIRIGQWEFLTDSWNTDDGNRALYVKKVTGNNQGDKLVVRADGTVIAPQNDVELSYKAIRMGDWRAVGTWWNADDAQRAFLVKKEKGNNQGDKLIVTADGHVAASNDFFSRGSNKWVQHK